MEHILALTNELKSIEPLQGQLSEYLYGQSVSDETIRTVTLVVEEILVNVIKHGYPEPDAKSTIELAVRLEDERVKITFCDDANPFNPVAFKSPKGSEEQFSGWGLPLVKNLCAKTSYYPIKGQNVLQVEILREVRTKQP